MKTLFLIRHAKSDWAIDELLDIDRPLNAKGYADAYKMSQSLKEKKIVPDVIITSPAIRAISTALIFSRKLNYNPSDILINSHLYNSSVDYYSEVVSNISSNFNCVLLFGHNPTISDFANGVCSSLKKEMNTCEIMGITKKVEIWKEFVFEKVKSTYSDFPKRHF